MPTFVCRMRPASAASVLKFTTSLFRMIEFGITICSFFGERR